MLSENLFSKVSMGKLKKAFQKRGNLFKWEIWIKHKMTTQSRPYLLSRGDEG